MKKRVQDMPMPQLGMEVPGLDDLITSESKYHLIIKDAFLKKKTKRIVQPQTWFASYFKGNNI